MDKPQSPGRPFAAVLEPPDSLAASRPAEQSAFTLAAASGPPPLRAGGFLRAAVLIGIAAGLVEAGYWAIRKLWLGEMIFLSPGVYWMAPVAMAASLLIVAAMVVLFARATNRPQRLRPAVGVLLLLAWLNTVLLVPGLNGLAYLLLSAGLAAMTARLLGRHGPIETLCRPRRLYLAVLFVGSVALAIEGGEWLAERRRIAGLPAAAASDTNVLLIVLDTVRADALNPAAGPAAMPLLAARAADGILFEHALAPSSWTLPSHGGLFTGRWPQELSGDWLRPLDNYFPTLAERLSAAGYRTAGFVANTRYASRETGLARGFSHYEDYRYTPADFVLTTALGRRLLLGPLPALCGWTNWPSRRSASSLNQRVLGWLEDGDAARPFFLFINYWDAHDPYVSPDPVPHAVPRTLADRQLLRNWWWIDKSQLSEEQVRFARAAYDDCVGYLDRQLNALLESLAAGGLLENTLVIITSDHGEHFGEHGLFAHGNSLYQPVVHVPLVMLGPWTAGPRRVAEPVSLCDVPATVLDLIGLNDADESLFSGTTLRRIWDDALSREPVDEPVICQIGSQAKFPPDHGRSPVARGEIRAVVVAGYKYIVSGDCVEELYDLRRDAGETQNLAAEPEQAATLGRLRGVLRGAETRPVLPRP